MIDLAGAENIFSRGPQRIAALLAIAGMVWLLWWLLLALVAVQSWISFPSAASLLHRLGVSLPVHRLALEQP
ncbi:MAG: hypothetical protein EA401_00560 [Planctomycetota bacterium]|nr:MAG: hypothetical protein EA401_00560 [Planctomycetota bacterium]